MENTELIKVQATNTITSENTETAEGNSTHEKTHDIEKTSVFAFTVDDGTVREVIRNKFGEEIGVLIFRPTDFGIIDRYNEVAKDFDKIVEPLEDVSIKSDGMVADTNDDASLNAMRAAEQRLYEACDYIFDGNVSKAFFGKMHPFSLIDGHFYCEKAIAALGDYISKRFEHEAAKINKRVNRYTHGYRTGKHRKGRK